MAIQLSSNTYPNRGFPGELSRPGEPYAIDFLPAQVPASGRKPRPGDGVYWNATANGAASASSAAQELLVLGIVHYDLSKVQDKLSAVPSGSDSAQYIEYEDGEFMPVIIHGSVYVRAGGACEYGNLMRFQEDDYKWDADNPSSYAETFRRSIECISLVGADEGLIEVRLSGRVH